jgi:hypothetical protein
MVSEPMRQAVRRRPSVVAELQHDHATGMTHVLLADGRAVWLYVSRGTDEPAADHDASSPLARDPDS